MDKLIPIEYYGQRVLITDQLANSLGTDEKRISENFNRNKDRHTEKKHFFFLQGNDLKAFKEANPQLAEYLKYASSIYLWTEKGAWMHAKSLNTDQAWEAYEALVDDYYVKIENLQPQFDVDKLSTDLQMFNRLFQSVAKNELDLVETRKELSEVKSAINTFQETFTQRDDQWRTSMNSMLNAAAFRSGGNYRDLRSESYKTLEERAHCDLNKRLRNLKDRLAESGATKTKIDGMTRMDVIEADAKLKEIYGSIVKEISIGSLKIAK